MKREKLTKEQKQAIVDEMKSNPETMAAIERNTLVYLDSKKPVQPDQKPKKKRKQHLNIVKQFLVTCDYCEETKIVSSYIDAKKWLPEHHKTCVSFYPFKNNTHGGRPLDGALRDKRGYRLFLLKCPICEKERYVNSPQYNQSLKHQKPEHVGICQICYMKVVKPAKGKGRLQEVK